MQFFYKANILVFIRLQRNCPLCPILKFVIDKDLAQMQQNKRGGGKKGNSINAELVTQNVARVNQVSELQTKLKFLHFVSGLSRIN